MAEEGVGMVGASGMGELDSWVVYWLFVGSVV